MKDDLRRKTPNQIAMEICSVQPMDPKIFYDVYERIKENEEIRSTISRIFMIPHSRVDYYMIESFRLGMKENKSLQTPN